MFFVNIFAKKNEIKIVLHLQAIYVCIKQIANHYVELLNMNQNGKKFD